MRADVPNATGNQRAAEDVRICATPDTKMHEAHVGARAEHCDYEEGPLIIQVVPKSQRNDAPALAQADVGIALGAGTDVVVEAGDVILVRSTPLDAVAIVRLARSTYRKMVQNLGWATGYNAVALPLAAAILYPFGIILTPAVGAVLMSASTILVAINSRFLKLAL